MILKFCIAILLFYEKFQFDDLFFYCLLIQLLRTAISMRADFVQAYINRGDILMKLNRLVVIFFFSRISTDFLGEHY